MVTRGSASARSEAGPLMKVFIELPEKALKPGFATAKLGRCKPFEGCDAWSRKACTAAAPELGPAGMAGDGPPPCWRLRCRAQ